MPLDTAKRDALLVKLTDPAISIREAAILLDVCNATVRRYTNAGALKCTLTLGVKPAGNRRRFQLHDVMEFIEERKRGGDRP